MTRQILAIDQSPCRASYGIMTQQDFRRDLAAKQKQIVKENIARFCADGDRMARIGSGQNTIAEIAAEAYVTEPSAHIVLAQIARPIFHLTEVSGGVVNIFI